MFGLTPVDSLRRIVANQTLIKRAMLVIFLAGLFIFEIGLLEGFLPYKWQQEIYQQSERIFPSKKYEPHPDTGWEFELDYRQHSTHRTGLPCMVYKESWWSALHTSSQEFGTNCVGLARKELLRLAR
jgi:hypothetical protein